MKLILVALLVSYSAFSSTWMDIEKNQDYKIKSPIKITTKSGKSLEIKNDVLTMIDVVGLDIVNVTLYEAKLYGCEYFNEESDLDIFEYTQGNQMTVVGTQLIKGCELELFVENVDLYKNSILDLMGK